MVQLTIANNPILIIGDSGSGKSTSMRNLDPKTTFIINVIDKQFPFKEIGEGYSQLSVDGMTGNYYTSANYNDINRVIKHVSNRMPHVNTLVIDDFQYIMSYEYLKPIVGNKNSVFEKFTEIAMHAVSVVNTIRECRTDLFCAILSHSEYDGDRLKLKTIGKMLDEKVMLVGLFNIVLHSVLSGGTYRFITKSPDQPNIKAPMGMFDEVSIDNDLNQVRTVVFDYFNKPTKKEKKNEV